MCIQLKINDSAHGYHNEGKCCPGCCKGDMFFMVLDNNIEVYSTEEYNISGFDYTDNTC